MSNHPIITTLADERRRQGLSMREVGRRMGVSPTSMSNWEGGATEPTLGSLERWAAALGAQVRVTLSLEEHD